MELFMFSALIYFILFVLVFFSVVRVPDKETKNIKKRKKDFDVYDVKTNYTMLIMYVCLITAAKFILMFYSLGSGFLPTAIDSILYPVTGVTLFASKINDLVGFASANDMQYMIGMILTFLAEAVGSVYLYKLATEKGFDHKKAQVFAMAFLLLPPLVVASGVFAWMSSVTIMFIIMGLYFGEKENSILAGLMLGFASVCEPIGLVVALVYLVYLALNKEKTSVKNYIVTFIPVLLIVPFVLTFDVLDALSLTFLGTKEASYVAPSLFSVIGGNGAEKTIVAQIITWVMTLAIIVIGAINLRKSEKEGKLYYILAMALTLYATLTAGQSAVSLAVCASVCIIGYIMTKDSFFAISFLGTSFISSLAVVVKLMYVKGNVASDDTFLVILSILAIILAIAFATVTFKRTLKTDSDKVVDNSKLSYRNKNTNFVADRLIETSNRSSGYQFQRSDLKTKIVKVDALLMALLMLMYGLFAFTNLGTTNTPQTEFQPLETNSSFEVKFDQPQNVARLYMFTTWIDRRTTDNNVIRDVEVFASHDNGATYEKITDMKFQDVLRWRYVPLIVNNVTNIRFNVNDQPRFVLNEMVFYDAAKNIVPVSDVVNISGCDNSVKNLFDEQDTAVYDPTWYDGSYFDEIYHPRTAYEFLHHYEMYENSHPPLGKLMMSLGIVIFGLSPFGWRFFGVFFAMMMIPVVYILAKKMFKNSKWAFIAGALLVFDCMTTVQARLATIDTYITFYIILMTLFMYSYYTKSFYDTKLSKTLVPLGLCGLSFGLGVASKWTGMYAGVGLAIVFFINFGKRCYEYYIACTDKKHTENNGISYEHIRNVFWKNSFITILFAFLMFVIVPAGIYVASYTPYFMIPTPNHDFSAFMRLQKHMFNYHSGLTATHPYASKWYQWPMIYKPMLYDIQTAEFRSEGMKYGIAALGNPLIWWMTFPCIFGSAIVAIRRKWTKEMTVIFTMFMSIWLLWSGISRNVFIYHFFTNTPLLMLWITFFLKYLREKCKVPMIAIWGYLLAVAVIYCMFYPVLVGMEVPATYIDNTLEWFNTWTLG